MITVFNLSTGGEHFYAGCTPTEAVVSAHAQSLGDWNTWQYDDRYGPLVVTNTATVRCGDFSAAK